MMGASGLRSGSMLAEPGDKEENKWHRIQIASH